MKIKRFEQSSQQETINEEYTDPNLIAGLATIAAFLGTAGAVLIKNMKGKSKEEQKEFLEDLRKKLNRVTGAD